MPFYAVAQGRRPGIYEDVDDAKDQTDGYSNGFFKRFYDHDDAVEFLNTYKCPSNTSLRIEEINGTDFVIDDDGYVVVYSDGACPFNGQDQARGGIGVWFGYQHELNVSARLLGRQTSVRAEIQAIIAAARRAHDAGVDNLVVFTDSHHAYDCYHKWDDRWERNGWFKADGTKVRNWEDLSSMEYYMGLFDNIRLEFVNGHSDWLGNTMADMLARRGSDKALYC